MWHADLINAYQLRNKLLKSHLHGNYKIKEFMKMQEFLNLLKRKEYCNKVKKYPITSVISKQVGN